MSNPVIIPDDLVVKGPRGRHCNCGTKRSYSEQYDSYYCSKCNWWLEPECSDKNCEFCTVRPERPA